MWQKLFLSVSMLIFIGCGAVPQPFRNTDNALTERQIPGVLTVLPIEKMTRIDPGGLIATAIQNCVVEALIKHQILAVKAERGETSSYLQGQLLRYQNGVGIFEWHLFDNQRSETKRFNTHISGISRLSYQPLQVCQTVAEQVKISLKGDQGDLGDQRQLVEPFERKTVYILPVQGVSERQSRAMVLLFINAAQQLDLKMVEDPKQADFYVQATASEQLLINQKVSLTFDWFLQQPMGQVLGDMQQVNQMTPTELKKWQTYYPFVAQSAAQGIQAMVQELGTYAPN